MFSYYITLQAKRVKFWLYLFSLKKQTSVPAIHVCMGQRAPTFWMVTLAYAQQISQAYGARLLQVRFFLHRHDNITKSEQKELFDQSDILIGNLLGNSSIEANWKCALKTFSYKQSGTDYPLLGFRRENKFWKIYALKQRFKGSEGELNVNAFAPTLCFNCVSLPW